MSRKRLRATMAVIYTAVVISIAILVIVQLILTVYISVLT